MECRDVGVRREVGSYWVNPVGGLMLGCKWGWGLTVDVVQLGWGPRRVGEIYREDEKVDVKRSGFGNDRVYEAFYFGIYLNLLR